MKKQRHLRKARALIDSVPTDNVTVQAFSLWSVKVLLFLLYRYIEER